MASKQEMEAALANAKQKRDAGTITPEEQAASERIWDAYQRKYGRFDTSEAVKTGFQGFNVGLADILGAPVDLMNRAPELLNLLPGEQGMTPLSENPVGGSQMLRSGLSSIGAGYQNIEDVPAQYRPIARGGEVLGQSAPVAALPLAAAQRPIQGISQFLSRTPKPVQAPAYYRAPTSVRQSPRGFGRTPGARTSERTTFTGPFVNTARSSPGTFAAAELSSATGAGLGAGIAEKVAPGDPQAALAGELAGGLVNPWSVLLSQTRKVSSVIDRAVASTTPQGRKYAAAKYLQGLTRDLGEDPRNIAGRIGTPDADAPSMTAGAMSQSPAIMALERKLIKDSGDFGGRLREQVERSIGEANASLRAAAQSGNPAALQAANQARIEYVNGLVQTRLARAEQRAQQVMQRIPPNDPAARSAANLRAREILDDAYADARAVENSLWEEGIDKTVPVGADGLSRGLASASEGLVRGETPPIDSVLLNAAEEIISEGGTTAGEMLTLRSRILTKAGELRSGANPKRDAARRLELIADNILDDLDGVPGSAEARQFSYDLNQRFTSNYPGKLRQTRGRGETVIPASQTIERGIAGGGDEAVNATNQLGEAAEFGAGRGMEMNQQVETVLRDMAQVVVNPRTGEIDPARFANWAQRNRAMLERFPQLRAQLQDAGQAQEILNQTRARAQAVQKATDKSAFAQVAGYDDPVAGVRSVLNGKRPVTGLNQLFRTARRAGPEAVAGLRASVIENVFKDATGANGLIDGMKLKDWFATPVGRQAIKDGIFTRSQVANLRRVADKSEQIQRAVNTGRELDEVIGEPDAILDMLLRVAGSTMATRGAFAGVTGGGNQLIIASAGSKALRRMVDKAPRAKVTTVLRDAIQDPQLMSELLTMSATRAPKEEAFRRLHAYFLQALVPENEDQGFTVDFADGPTVTVPYER